MHRCHGSNLCLHYICCDAESGSGAEGESCLAYMQLHLEFTYGLLANDNLAECFWECPQTASWLVSVMKQEAQSSRPPDRLYLAGACLARLFLFEPMELSGSPDEPEVSDLYDQQPDAPKLLDTCLQSVFQASAWSMAAP